MKYVFLDQGATADVEFEAYGDSLEELFENAALATFKVMSDPERVGSKLSEEIKEESEDLEALLYDFLERFLILHDSKNMVFSGVKVRGIKRKGKNYTIEATVKGEKLDPEKHVMGTHVKAITYHGMKIGMKDGKHFCYLILDI